MGSFQTVLARAVLGPERFRGRLLLRRRLSSIGARIDGLSRAAIRRVTASDARALAAWGNGVNASFDDRLAGRVVLELVLGELKPDQMLEGRIGDRRPDGGVRKRVHGGVGFAGLTRPGEDLANPRRQGRRGAIDSNGGLDAGHGAHLPCREIEYGLPDLLGDHRLTALQRDIEIRQDDLPRRTGIAPQPGDGEGRRRDYVGADVLARGAQVRDLRTDVDRARIRASRRIEQSDVAGAQRDAGDWTGAPHGINTASVFTRDVAGVPAGAKQDHGGEGGEAKLHLVCVLTSAKWDWRAS